MQLLNAPLSQGRTDEQHAMRVQLIRKLAECVDGIDLSGHREGDVLDMSRHEAELLIAEGWASPLRHSERREIRWRASAFNADSENVPTLERDWRVPHDVHEHRFEAHDRQRAEDRVRERLHDERARTVERPPDVGGGVQHKRKPSSSPVSVKNPLTHSE